MRLPVPAGGTLDQARQRLHGAGWWLPTLLTDGASAATSNRAIMTATANALPHTVGVWTEVVAALSADVFAIGITQASTTSVEATDTSALLNVGVGAAASEVTVIPSLAVGWSAASITNHLSTYLFPLFIRKGSRVAIQTQAAVTLQAAGVRIEFFAAPQWPIPSSKIVALGANLGTSRGVTLATPGGANTEGAWTEIVAATAEPFAAIGVGIQGGGDTSQASAAGLLDIGVGSAGNEWAVVSDMRVFMNTSEGVNISSQRVHQLQVPAGSRLSARWQGSAVTGAIDVILYGVRMAA